MSRLAEYFNRQIPYKRWELVKYALVTMCILLPCVGRFFHYFTVPCLLTFIAFFCLCFGLLVIWRIPRKWMIPFVVVGVGGVAYQAGIGKPLGYQTLTAMYETNYREALGFLSSPYSVPLLLGGAAVLIALLWIIVGEKPLPYLDTATFVRRKYLLPLLILSAILFSITRWQIFETYPLCLFYENFMYIDENITISDYRSAKYECPKEYLRNDDSDETYVLIIGEATRRSSCSAYGYERKTTPHLDALLKNSPSNVVLFSDAISTAAFTKASVMSIYSPFTHAEELSYVHSKPGLSKIFKGAGFSTLYVTPRPRYSIRNMLSTFLDDAAKAAYLTTLTKKRYDEDAIPVITDFIDKTPGKKFIIWHLLGSHIEYAAQYPKSFKFFDSGRLMIDTYDDSIRYGDDVQHQLIRHLLQRKHPAVALFAPDHGENLNDSGDNNYGHGTKALTPYELKLPFVVYMNDSFTAKHPQSVNNLREKKDSPINHDNIAHTFMGFAGISDPYVYKSPWDLTSTEFAVNIRWVTDENMRLNDYATMDFSRKNKIREFKEQLEEKYRAKFTW
jgi:glucan phosphoethanolaminetransferase (alkaline phosphatase superfamily)